MGCVKAASWADERVEKMDMLVSMKGKMTAALKVGLKVVLTAER